MPDLHPFSVKQLNGAWDLPPLAPRRRKERRSIRRRLQRNGDGHLADAYRFARQVTDCVSVLRTSPTTHFFHCLKDRARIPANRGGSTPTTVHRCTSCLSCCARVSATAPPGRASTPATGARSPAARAGGPAARAPCPAATASEATDCAHWPATSCEVDRGPVQGAPALRASAAPDCAPQSWSMCRRPQACASRAGGVRTPSGARVLPSVAPNIPSDGSCSPDGVRNTCPGERWKKPGVGDVLRTGARTDDVPRDCARTHPDTST